MKTKTKMLALLEIAIVLCSVFLVALPVTTIATEQDDYVLDVYGNANEDDTIDMRDLTYVKLIFFGKKPETELSDAKYDGQINPLDFIQIKLIIVGKEKELTIVDDREKAITIPQPIESMVILWPLGEPVYLLGAQDKVVGVGKYVPELLPLPEWVAKPIVDEEIIAELNPQVVIGYTKYVEKYEEKLGSLNTKFVVMNLYKPVLFDSDFRILGKMLGKEEKAEEFLLWKDSKLDLIKERVEGLEQEDKVRIYGELTGYSGSAWTTFSKGSSEHETVVMAGGINIAADMLGTGTYPSYPKVDPEWVIEKNPEVIIMEDHGSMATGYKVKDDTGVKQIIEEVNNRMPWTDAVKNDRVYALGIDLTEGTRTFIGVCYLAKSFYPNLFEDIHPEEIHREYFEDFLCADYQGVYTYPELS